MRSWGWCWVVLVVSLATACSGSEDTSGEDTGSTPTWSTPDGSAPSSVNRPSEVTVDDVWPCDLLTDDQRGEFGLTGKQTSDLSTTWATDTCKIEHADNAHVVSLTAVTVEGIADFYRGRFTNMEYKPTEVRGFPALFYRFENAEHACYLAVDIADDQLIDAAFGANGPDSTDKSQDELCDTAHKITEAAVDTLLATG